MQRRYPILAGGMLLGLGLLAACTSFTSDGEVVPGSEGGADALVVPADGLAPTPSEAAPIDAALCVPGAPFGKPVLVPSLNAANHNSLSARVAGEFLYFISDRHLPGLDFNNSDIYRARIQGDAFTELRHLETVSTAGVEDVAPTESADGKVLYLAVGNIGARRIKQSVRMNTTLDYGTPSALPTGTIVSGADQESDPYLVGQHLYFTSRLNGDASSGIYEVDVAQTGPVGTASRVAGPFNGTLRYPVVDAVETELYFIEYIGNVPTPFVARRATPNGPFVAPAALPALVVPKSTNLNVTGLSADGCDLYLAARLGETAPFDIYRARRGVP